ncbi:MAG: TonB-dependent receptor [Verrucomicrobia bacterium]|nr:TonB-dependent receptor [Verrucomicrobiota bacterium]
MHLPPAARAQTRARVAALLSGLAFSLFAHSTALAQAAATASRPASTATTPGTAAVTDKNPTALDRFFVTDDKLAPFTSANVDLPRSVDDVQPYYFYDAREIEFSGSTNLEDFLRTNMTMDTSAAAESQNLFIGGNPSSVNLRGLGDGQTLILINGRRAPAGNLALNGGGSQANLNGIPMSAVDRIEVLPSSAGAIYGGGAVGGVINIVLKRDFQGGHVRASWQNPDDTDAPVRRYDASYGFAVEGGRTRITLSTSYSDQKLLVQQDRPFMTRYEKRIFRNTGLAGAGVLPVGATPNIRNSNVTVPLILKNGGGSIGSAFTWIPYGTTPNTPFAALAAGLRANAETYNQDRGTYSRQFLGGSLQDMGQGQRSKSVSTAIRREMNPNLEFSVDFSLSSTGHARNGNGFQAQAVSAAAPSNPFTTAINIYPPLPGAWPTWGANMARSLTAGFVQKLPRGWRAQGDYTWNSTSNAFYSQRAGSTLATADITADLNAGRLNPFVDTTLYPFDLSRYQGVYSYTGKGGSNNVALRAAGPVWRLPGGTPRLSLGLERYQQGQKDSVRYETFPNYPNRNTQVQGLGKSQITVSQFAELQIPVIGESNKLPLVRQLSLQTALRRDDYEVHTGTASITILPVPAVKPVVRANIANYLTTKPTAGFSWKPHNWVLLRASVGRGFTPPRYTQLVLDPTPSATAVNIVDPKRGGARTPVFTIAGGNPELEPESSKTMNAGLVLTPDTGLLKGLRFSLDYNFTRTRDNIGSLTTQQIVDFETQYPERITRAAPVAGDPFNVGLIETVNISPLNLLKSYVETFDATVSWRRTLPRAGTLSLSSRTTFGNHYKRKTSLTQPMIEYGNVSGFPLKFLGNASLTWDYQRFTARWTTRYYCRYRVPGPPISALSVNVIPQGGEFVAAQIYSDVLFGYRLPERGRGSARSWLERALPGAEFQFGIDNVLKKVPPYDYYSQYNYSSRGNPRLRDFRLSVKQPL